MTVRYTEVLSTAIYQDALTIRREVFIKEQGVSEAIEIDGEEGCLHFVLYSDTQPMATCRLLKKEPHIAKLQRMAVLKEGRGLQLGKQLMSEAEKIAAAHGFKEIILGAQNTAIGFYEKLGYHTDGPEFLDANIPHHMMKKEL